MVYQRFIVPDGRREKNKKPRNTGQKPIRHFRTSRIISREDLKKHELLQAVAITNVKVGKELFVDFGETSVCQEVNIAHFSEESGMRNRRVKLHC